MTKKKLIITITSLCLVVVAAVAAVVGILAATQVNITSSLTVTYTPDASVIATVAGNYQVENSADPTQIGSHNYVYGQKQATTDTINLTKAIELNDTNKYVVFEFSFANNAVEGNSNSQKLDVAVAGLPEAQQMTVVTKYSASKVALTKTGFESINAEASAATLLQDITRGNTAYMYILVERTAGIQGSWTASSIAFTLTATA